jgi:DNA-binding LacI/PurR family transcriptional regulator
MTAQSTGLLLIVPLMDSPLLEYHQHTHLPCVVVGSTLPESLGFYCIDSANEPMMRLLVNWLLEQGHRRIGFIKGPDSQWSTQPAAQGVLGDNGSMGR